MQIEQATLNDARAVAEIHVATWRDAYEGIVPAEHFATKTVASREAMWRETIIKGTPTLYVAKLDAKVVGWVSFGPSREKDATKFDAEIWAIYVASSCWSKGLGKALWLKAQSILKENGFQRICLWVLAENSRAIKFYHKMGFATTPIADKEVVMSGKKLKEICLVTEIH